MKRIFLFIRVQFSKKFEFILRNKRVFQLPNVIDNPFVVLRSIGQRDISQWSCWSDLRQRLMSKTQG